jgi:ATP-dependent RNA helicase RhlB
MLVGTRVAHRLLEAAHLRPGKVEVLVIDEADRMFDMGFIADLRFILRRCPSRRSGSSVPLLGRVDRVRELTWESMNNPSRSPSTDRQQTTAERRSRCSTTSGARRKFNLQLGLLAPRGRPAGILIYSNTRRARAAGTRTPSGATD